MSRADTAARGRSPQALFADTLGVEAEALIDEIIRRCDPPIRVVTKSTWALKAGGLVHCAVCKHIRGERVELARERRGLCDEHAEWKIVFIHHSWSPIEQHQAAVEKLRQWLGES